jgi:hypothetical protein
MSNYISRCAIYHIKKQNINEFCGHRGAEFLRIVREFIRGTNQKGLIAGSRFG